jgi:ATP-binding cassette subfamily B protein
MAANTEAEMTAGQSGLKSLVIVAGHYQLHATVDGLRHEHVLGDEELTDGQLIEVAGHIGLQARLLQPGAKTDIRSRLRGGWSALVAALKRSQAIDAASSLDTAVSKLNLPDFADVLPALARLSNGNVVVVAGLQKRPDGLHVGVIDPLASSQDVILLPLATFVEAWNGTLLLVRKSYSLGDEDQPFSLRWFVPEILRQKQVLRDVILGALSIQVVGLAVPIYLRVVLDRVLVHKSEATLAVLTLGVVLSLSFEGLFTYLRSFLLLQATNKIDIRLATRIFAHLLSLPISFFEVVPSGVTVRHLQQAEKIRGFLTGRLLSVALESTTLLIYLPLLAYFSVKLTFLVLGFGAVLAGVVLVLVGPFRVRLRALYNAEAERQAMLVETVNGMRSVKSLALEPAQRRNWEERSAKAVNLHNRVGTIAAGVGALTSYLEKLMSVAVIAVGAVDVFSGDLSVGALIAFQMLAGRVISPLVQMASLIQDYQDTALSVRMLGEVMNRKPEPRSAEGGMEPKVVGQIELDRVTFRYIPGGTPALDKVGLRIAAGKVVAVVGRSGSGKSTVAKLLQGLYPLQDGVIRIDGVDIREFDLSYLRRNVCVVPQDTFIFRGSVRANIALTNRSASLEEIIAAARLAGADEFIERLPNGYDTELEEGGQNLSGGQKQRLSISRALLLNPPILILDEATSALDPDSEAIFMDNLAGIAKNRTTLIISHRLNTLVMCDAIIVLEQGRIVDGGRHSELMERCEIYSHLWHRQNRHL